MRTLLDAGVGIEAGVWSVEDAERLAASGLGDRVTRVLIEPVDVSAGDALAVVDEIHAALDRLGLTAPRLQHGDGEATWVLCATRSGAGSTPGSASRTRSPGRWRPHRRQRGPRAAARELGAGS
jgi:hypothetical protein